MSTVRKDLNMPKIKIDRSEYNPDLYSTDYFYQRGMECHKSGKFQEAITNFDAVIQRDFTYAEAFNSRGVIKLLLNDVKGAITDLDAALIINSELGIAYKNRGRAKYKLAEIKLADFVQRHLDKDFRKHLTEVYSLKTAGYGDIEKGNQFPLLSQLKRPCLLFNP